MCALGLAPNQGTADERHGAEPDERPVGDGPPGKVQSTLVQSPLPLKIMRNDTLQRKVSIMPYRSRPQAAPPPGGYHCSQLWRARHVRPQPAPAASQGCSGNVCLFDRSAPSNLHMLLYQKQRQYRCNAHGHGMARPLPAGMGQSQHPQAGQAQHNQNPCVGRCRWSIKVQDQNSCSIRCIRLRDLPRLAEDAMGGWPHGAPGDKHSRPLKPLRFGHRGMVPPQSQKAYHGAPLITSNSAAGRKSGLPRHTRRSGQAYLGKRQ